MADVVYKITSPEEIKKWIEENKDVGDIIEESAKSIHEKVEGEEDVDKLVLYAKDEGAWGAENGISIRTRIPWRRRGCV